MRIPLRLQPVLIALTLLNLGILGVAIARNRPSLLLPSRRTEYSAAAACRSSTTKARYEPASQSIQLLSIQMAQLTLKRCCSG